jgi:hypothetical protein
LNVMGFGLRVRMSRTMVTGAGQVQSRPRSREPANSSPDA